MNIHFGYLPGCIGRVAQMHADYYSAATGFGVEFEAKVATELAEFCRGYREGRDGLWLAVDGQSIEGSIVIDGSHLADQGAHLRWFITSDRARGSGIGTLLLRSPRNAEVSGVEARQRVSHRTRRAVAMLIAAGRIDMARTFALNADESARRADVAPLLVASNALSWAMMISML